MPLKYICCCTDITLEQHRELCRNSRPASYKALVRKIKKDLPDLYDKLALDFPNPYDENCAQTRTHYLLVHSAIEYFISKE